METSTGIPSMLQKIFLLCGLIAPLLYVGTDILAGKLIKGYDFAVQSMSDLPAIGSPTRSLVLALTFSACVFMIAFGIGMWQVIGPARLPRIVAGLLIGNAVTGLIAHLIFPNRYGMQPEFGTPGVLLMFVSVLCFVLAMIFGAVAFQGWIRVLSIGIPAAYVILAVLRFITASSSTQGASVLIGIQERTMSYSFLLWVLAVALYLLSLSNSVVNSFNGIGG